MNRKIRILHIDTKYQGHVVTIHEGALVQSSLSLSKTLEAVKKQEFDLILSEPQNLAILPPDKSSPSSVD